MKLAELSTKLRESWRGNSPQFLVALLWAFGAAFGGSGMVALLTVPPFAYGGPMSASPIWQVPSELGGVLLVMSFIVCIPIGGVAGWQIGGFIHDCATSQPNLAGTLLFSTMLIPAAVGGAFLTLIMVRQDGFGGALIPIAEIGALSAFAAVTYRLSIGRVQCHGDKPRGSSSDADVTGSTINHQPTARSPSAPR
jgi:hypothetical protein